MDIMSNDSTLIANEFNNYFANIGQSLSNSIKQPKNRTFEEYLKNPPTSKRTFKNISEGDTLKIINNLNSKKSSGHDGLSLNLLKDIRISKTNYINHKSIIKHWYFSGQTENSENNTSRQTK